MREFLVRRLLLTVPTVWGVVTLVFLLIHLIPGDPVEIMLGESALPADRAAMRSEWGLDRPILEQYGHFFLSLCQGPLCRSLHHRGGYQRRDDAIWRADAQGIPATSSGLVYHQQLLLGEELRGTVG